MKKKTNNLYHNDYTRCRIKTKILVLKPKCLKNYIIHCIIAWCDWEKMIIKGYIDMSKYIFQTVLSNTAIKRILVSPSTVYADICQYSKKK